MNTTKTIYGAIAITFIVAVLALFGSIHHTTSPGGLAGAVATSTTNLPSLGVATLQVGTNCDTNYGNCIGLTTTVSAGNCTAATTTLFAVQNPFGATSTVTFGEIYGTQGATTTDIVMATSTTAFSGLDTANYNVAILKGNFLSLMSVPTTTVFYGATGPTFGNLFQGTTTNAYGTTSTNKSAITVGPSEYMIGYSTSTWTGAGGTLASSGNGSTASGFQPIPSSCRYVIQWQR